MNFGPTLVLTFVFAAAYSKLKIDHTWKQKRPYRNMILQTGGPCTISLTRETVPINKHICAKLYDYIITLIKRLRAKGLVFIEWNIVL